MRAVFSEARRGAGEGQWSDGGGFEDLGVEAAGGAGFAGVVHDVVEAALDEFDAGEAPGDRPGVELGEGVGEAALFEEGDDGAGVVVVEIAGEGDDAEHGKDDSG